MFLCINNTNIGLMISKNKQEPSPPLINEAHMMIVYYVVW